MPSTAWRETIPEGEAALHERLAEQLRSFQREDARGGPAMRALHAKGQAGLLAELSVLPGLPEHARAGLFAAPASYRAYVRFSNGNGRPRADKKPDVRGVAIKVVGVRGQKLIPGMEDAQTQDFLLIKTPRTPFHDAAEFVSFVRATRSPLLMVPRMVARFGLLRALGILAEVVRTTRAPASLATTQYFTAVPIRFGAYAARLTLAPRADTPPGVHGSGPEFLADELAARLRKGAVAYDLRAQFFEDEDATPIEDGAALWSEARAPFVTVATLTLLEQDVSCARGRRVATFVERLSFDPWHALVVHRPLGNLMRARNPAYRLSVGERGAAPEPDGRETFAP